MANRRSERDAAGAKRTTSRPKTEDRGVIAPMVDAVRAHPLAAAAAVAAGGAVAAAVARGSRSADEGRSAARKRGSAAPRKQAARGGARRTVGGGLMRQVRPDAQLGAVIGEEPLTRADITRRLWDYIKRQGLQDKTDGRLINADDQLRPIFGADQVSMFEMTRLVSQHVSDA